MKNTYLIWALPLLSFFNPLKGADEPVAFPDKTKDQPALLFEQPAFEKFDPSPLFVPSERKNPFIAVSLATIWPGLGHAYLGDFQTAGGIFASYGVLGGLTLWNKNPYQASSLAAVQNLFSYNIYAAYRDVRAYNREEGYFYKMPTDSFSDLALAPFQWSIIKKPEVFGGVLGALTLAGIVSYFAMPEQFENRIALSSSGDIFPLVAFPVAIGEEAFFRGFLQSTLYDSLTPIGSIILSSIAFGAAHIPNAFFFDRSRRRQYFTFSLPFITTFGAYFGYLTYKNCSLRESVAVHAWYDFILFAVSYSVTQSAATQTRSIGFSLSF